MIMMIDDEPLRRGYMQTFLLDELSTTVDSRWTVNIFILYSLRNHGLTAILWVSFYAK